MIKKILPLTLVMLSALTSCTKNSPEEVTDRFYDALCRSAYTEALTYTNVSSENATQVAEIMKSMKMNIHAYEVLSSEMEEGDTTASVLVHTKVTFSEGSDTVEATPEVRCAKRDGEWKVLFL